MTTLWNPRKPLNQPRGYGSVNCVKAEPTSSPLDERLAAAALKHSRIGRSRNRGSATVFDRSKPS